MSVLPKLLFLLIVILSACTQHKHKDSLPSETVLTTLHFTSDKAIESCSISFPGLDTLLLFTEGEASLQIPLESPAYADIYLSNAIATEVYLDPGYDLRIQIGDEVTFQGIGAESNTYLQKYFRFIAANKIDDPSRFKLEPAEFEDQSRHNRIKSGAFLKHYQSKAANLDPKFMERERARIEYLWINDLISYPDRHKEACSCDIESDHLFSQEIMDEGSNSEVHLLPLKAYRHYIKNYLMLEANALVDQQGESRAGHAIAFDLIDDALEDERMHDLIYYELIKDALRYPLEQWHETLLDVFEKRCDNPRLKQDIAQHYAVVLKESSTNDVSAAK